MAMHPQLSGPYDYDDQPATGLVTSNAYVASSTINRNANRNDSLYRPGSSVSNRDNFGLVKNEIAFEVRGEVPQYAGDFGRNLGGRAPSGRPVHQHSRANVLTSLNGFETNTRSLTRAQIFINNLQNLTRADAQELFRDVVASKFAYRGINMTEHNATKGNDQTGYGTNLKSVTLQVAGVATLPVLKGGIRIGSFVEAVPMTPLEHAEFSSSVNFSSRFVHTKAQMLIRELKRSSVVDSILRNGSLFMQYYPQMVQAFGSDSQTMQRFAAFQGIQRFAVFCGIRMSAFMTEKRAAAAAAAAAGAVAVPDPFNLLDVAARGGAAGAALSVDNIERALALGLGIIGLSISGANDVERNVAQFLGDADNAKMMMEVSRDFTKRVIFPGQTTGNDNSHIHGIADLATANGAWTTNAQTGQKMPDTTTAGGRFLQLQLNEPRDLLETCLSSMLCEMRNVIGVAISGSAQAQDISKCSVLLQNSAVVR